MEGFGATGFEVVRKLADGAVAEVFLARPTPAAPEAARALSQVVLKVLRPQLTADAQVVGRFLDEAKVCEGLSHPNVLRHLCAGRMPDGRVYLVTEYLEGEDLRARLQARGPIPPEELLRLMLPLCDALDYVHARGVVHRDLKPENVFLAKDGPRLLDFGLAHFQGNKTVQTAEGLILATPEYTPPECVQGEKATPQSDLYALGVLLFEALTGAPPFVSNNYAELLLLHLNAAPPPLTGPGAYLAPVVLRCLAKVPADRFARARDVAAALAECSKPDSLPGTFVRSSHPKPLPLTEAVPPPAGVPGQRLGSYELVRLLGEGAMGQVYLAKHVKLGRQVAIKLLKPEHSANADFVQRFFQEARTVNEIRNEHIVDIQDFSDLEAGGPVYCVMELLAGHSLTALLQQGPLPVARAVNIARQLAGALGAAHAAGVVHRDIKPDNIFITERSGISDYVKVLDFGVAKLQRPIGELSSHSTSAGAIIGTPTYMAPEQASGLPADARTDIYALGTVLYEMLSGRPPFEGELFGQLVVKLTTLPPPPLPARGPQGEPIPKELVEVVLRCLEKEPARRPASMGEVAELLRGALAPSPRSAAQPEVPPRLARSRAPLYVAGAVLAVLLGGGLALSRGRPSAPPPAPEPIAAAAPEPAAEPKLSEVKLTVRTEPPGVKVVRLDSGAELGRTPLVLRVAAREQPVSLRLTLAGHEPQELPVRLASDVDLSVTLQPMPKPKPAKRAAKRASGKRGTSREDVIDPFQ